MIERRLQESLLARGEIVINGDAVSLGKKPISEIAPNEPRPAGDEGSLHD